MAFSVEGYHSRERKSDPRYVKYLIRIVGRKNGELYERVLPYHECTDADWATFPPASKASKDSFETIKSDPKRGMFCIDWGENANEEDDIVLYGNENNDEYQRIEFMLNPCNYVH